MARVALWNREECHQSQVRESQAAACRPMRTSDAPHARDPAPARTSGPRPPRILRAMSVTVPVNPRVMRWARESVGIGRQEAADRLSVNVALVEAWEDGAEHPTFASQRELSTFYRRPMAALLLTELPKDPPAPADFRVATNGEDVDEAPMGLYLSAAMRKSPLAAT